MKTTVLSTIVALGIVVAGISGVAKADHYHDVVENRVVTYRDNCNNFITVNEPVVVRYRYHNHILYDIYGRPYSPYIYYPYIESWRYSSSKPRGIFGYRYNRGLRWY